MDFASVRHNGRARHESTALHHLWGWLPSAGERAPAFTYSTLSDVCAATLNMGGAVGMKDAFTLADAVNVCVLRYTLHNGTAVHNSEPQYCGKELV